MTVAELREHIARLGGRSPMARALPCSRTSVRQWVRGEVGVAARWAERIRALPTPPPRPPKAAKPAAVPAVHPRQLPLPMGVLAVAPAAEASGAEARA
jgi:hypothetical protein